MQALAILSQAMADVGATPGTEYLSRLSQAMSDRLKSGSLQQLAFLMNGFASAGHHPGPGFLDDIAANAKELLLTDTAEM